MKAIKVMLIFGLVALGLSACADDQVFDSEVQFITDTTLIEQFLEQNNIVAQTHSSGLRYKITTQGTGDNANFGSSVEVKYTGFLLDGTEFDSNVGVGDFFFVVDRGDVIRGWDIAFKLLNKGAAATLYIPSGLAYGNRINRAIPANSVLIFDVRVLTIR
jgi:FKBP-type peptidyl-prolyl cis-trans isomerase FkpA